MGDVADILQVKPRSSEVKSKPVVAAAKKPKGMSRELFNLTSGVPTPDGSVDPSISPEPPVTTGRKFTINPSFKARHWEWRRFINSARVSQENPIKHWSRADTDPNIDYPFCRFNKPCYVVRFTLEEYQKYVPPQAQWSEEEDFLLLQLCKRFDCRFPVVSDRFHLSSKTSLACKQRYFALARISVQHNVKNFSKDEEADPKLPFDCRNALKSFKLPVNLEKQWEEWDAAFFQSNETHDMAAKLALELKQVDEEIKKLLLDQKRDENDDKRKKKKMKREANEVSAENVDALLKNESARGSRHLACWKRSDEVVFGSPLISVSQLKLFYQLCNVRPQMATKETLELFQRYREDCLKLVAFKHSVKQRREAMIL